MSTKLQSNPELFIYHFDNIKHKLDVETQVIIEWAIIRYIVIEEGVEHDNSIDFTSENMEDFRRHFEAISGVFPPGTIGDIRRRLRWRV